MYEVVFADNHANVLASYAKKKLVAATNDAKTRAQRHRRATNVLWRDSAGRRSVRAAYDENGVGSMGGE